MNTEKRSSPEGMPAEVRRFGRDLSLFYTPLVGVTYAGYAAGCVSLYRADMAIAKACPQGASVQCGSDWGSPILTGYDFASGEPSFWHWLSVFISTNGFGMVVTLAVVGMTVAWGLAVASRMRKPLSERHVNDEKACRVVEEAKRAARNHEPRASNPYAIRKKDESRFHAIWDSSWRAERHHIEEALHELR